MQLNPITVEYKVFNTMYSIKKYFKELDTNYDIIACDFETACAYSEAEQTLAKQASENEILPYIARKEYLAIAEADALSHPAYVQITHLAIAISSTKAVVIITDSDVLRREVLSWLVTTELKQIWHNASFDFKHIYYHTKQFPKDYEDTQLLAKSVLNHVDITKAKSGLKDLAGTKYGAWGISSENFTLTNMKDPKLLEYAAIDACATFWLWESMNNYLKEATNEYKAVIQPS